MKSTSKNSLCIFCFKPPVSISRQDNFETKRKFLKLFSRYLELNIKSENFVNSNELVSCEDCFFLGESFCDLYFQLESLKLQLNWKARKIFDTIRFAGKVSSRCSAFINQFADDDNSDRVLNAIQGLRRNLLKHCTKKMRSTFPKVLINRNSTDGLSQNHTRHQKSSPDENVQTAINRPPPTYPDNCKESLNQVQTGDEDNAEIEKYSEPDIGYSELVVNGEEEELELESDADDDETLFTPSEEASTVLNEGFQRDPLETEPVKSLRCPECTMTFTYQTALNFHLKLHKGFERRTDSERLRTNNVDVNLAESSRGMGINIISEQDARQASEAIPVNHQYLLTHINENIPELHSVPATSEVKFIVESGNSQELGQVVVDNQLIASCSQTSSSSTQRKPKTVYKCTPCNMHFEAGSQFLHHMFWAHGRVFRLKYPPTSTSSSTVPTNGLYVCPELKCMVHCPTKPELIEHIWTHTKENAVASGQDSSESLAIPDFERLGFQPQPEHETVENTDSSSVTASDSQQLGSDYVSFFHHRSEKSRNNHYVCSHCPFQTMNNTEIHQHVKIHLKGTKPRPKTKCKPSTAKSLPCSSRASISTSIVVNNLRTKSVTKHPKKYKCDVEGCGSKQPFKDPPKNPY